MTGNTRRSSLASGGVADTRKVFVLLGDKGDGEAAYGPAKLGLVLDETERLPRGKGGEGILASSIRPASSIRQLHPRELYAMIHVIFSDANIQVYLHNT